VFGRRSTALRAAPHIGRRTVRQRDSHSGIGDTSSRAPTAGADEGSERCGESSVGARCRQRGMDTVRRLSIVPSPPCPASAPRHAREGDLATRFPGSFAGQPPFVRAACFPTTRHVPTSPGGLPTRSPQGSCRGRANFGLVVRHDTAKPRQRTHRLQSAVRNGQEAGRPCSSLEDSAHPEKVK
jgi:hypothetical protein